MTDTEVAREKEGKEKGSMHRSQHVEATARGTRFLVMSVSIAAAERKNHEVHILLLLLCRENVYLLAFFELITERTNYCFSIWL